MTTVLFLFYLITTPTDRIVCSLWVNQPPTQEALIAACGFSGLGNYRLDVVPISGGPAACSIPATSLLWVVEDCGLTTRLDQYKLLIIQPAVTELVCSVESSNQERPTIDEIAAQCPDHLAAFQAGTIDVQYIGVANEKPAPGPRCVMPELAIGDGLYQQAPSAEALHTDESLTWLAGRLIWFGIVKPDCGGFSGLDPFTLAANTCGMDSARPKVIDWQNQFDGEIYAAAVYYHVPARLLKRILIVESQMWPHYSGAAGETGPMQVTDNGADVMLRYDPDLDGGYPTKPQDEQTWARRSLLDLFACDICRLDQAIEHIRITIPLYTRLLAAYRCRAVSVNSALAGDAAWRQAVADYNGSEIYLGKVEQ